MEKIIPEFKGEYSFLSNFYPSSLAYGEFNFRTVEHAFQASKTSDLKEKMKIMRATTPGKAKKLGREIKIREDWEEVKLIIMKELLYKKFLLHKDLRKKLIETEDAILIEGNRWKDTFWGVDLETGKGENNLGKLLMEVREIFRKEGK